MFSGPCRSAVRACPYVRRESGRDDVTFSLLLTGGPFSAGFMSGIACRTEQLDSLSFSVTRQKGESSDSGLNVNVFPLI